MTEVYQVCIPHTHHDFFDYEAQGLTPCIGARVWVPFRKQIRLGIVIHKEQTPPENTILKSIHALIDEQPLITADLLALCQWIGNYYQSPLSEVLALALPKKYRMGQISQLPMADYFQLQIPLEEAKKRLSKRAHKQVELLEFFANQTVKISKQSLLQLGYQSKQFLALIEAQIIHVSQEVIIPEPFAQTSTTALELNPQQETAVATITAELLHYQCFLLQGVTGSGKTEVYLQVISQVLAQGKQILILVPEIGLTPQLLSRFTARFQQPIGVLHSHLNDTERQVTWQLAKENLVKIVIGTRSSVFTPMPALGLIIIDEEHDSSLKQMEGVRYSARDTALMRAYQANIPIVLGSATPSLESVYNAKIKKYTLLRLQHKALSNQPLHFQLIDLRSQVLQNGLAKPSLALIEEHLQKNNQVLVFINRRGFAPVLLCHSCGWMADCRACDSHLTLHKNLNQMLCHHCGLNQTIPVFCQRCKKPELIPLGSGTQRIYEGLSTRFPNTQILRIDRDEVRKKNSLANCLDKISKGEAQLIVGTQMLAKGHHFPNLSLVVILDVDAGLYNQDFRALEHLGQLLIQVSGRAGRAHQAGQVLIQTHVPHHPLLNVLIQQGYDEFADALLNTRQQATLPPFHFLAILRAKGKVPEKILQFLNASKEQIQNHPLTIMGPAPAPLSRKANQHQMQLFIKSPSRKMLNQALKQWRSWLLTTKIGSSISWNIDIDPMNLS